MATYAGTLFEKPPVEVEKEQAPVRQLTEVESVLKYMLAGNATFTLRSEVTGTRFTYKVKAPKTKKDQPQPVRGWVPFDKNKKVWFVYLLVGTDNNASYRYTGMISLEANGACSFRTTRASIGSVNAPSTKAFAYLMTHLSVNKQMPPKCEFWHSGRCGHCGKLLTVPESIERGIGPECAKKM